MKIAFLLIIIVLLSQGCVQEKEEKHAGPVVKITFGVETSFLTSPVWVAENKGYFQEEGIDVEIKEFSSGKTALASMLNDGNLDMVTVAQTPVMFNSFKRDDYAIIGAMVYSENDVKIMTRLDSRIKDPSDLRGKKIGVTKGSTGHFYLGLFLVYASVDMSEVDIVDIEASELPQALADRRVEAISSWEPHIFHAKNLLGENAIIIPPEGGATIFREDFYFVTNKNFIKNNPQTMAKFLKAIEKAADFIQKNREESITIVSQRLKVDREFVTSIWDDFEFQLLLDQTILVTLEDEARWAIKNNLSDTAEIPNYLDYIYFDALDEIKPEVVTIIH